MRRWSSLACKTATLAFIVAASFAGSALAGQCEVDIEKIDQALDGMELAPDERAQVQDMRAQAAQLCKAGNEQEGLDITAEAKAMLNIE